MGSIAKRDRDAYLAHLLASGRSLNEAAKLARCSRATVARRRADPEFGELLRREVQLIVEEARRHLVANANKATQVLVEISSDRQQKAMSRIAAARSLLEFGLRFTEVIDVNARLRTLESEWAQYREEKT